MQGTDYYNVLGHLFVNWINFVYSLHITIWAFNTKSWRSVGHYIALWVGNRIRRSWVHCLKSQRKVSDRSRRIIRNTCISHRTNLFPNCTVPLSHLDTTRKQFHQEHFKEGYWRDIQKHPCSGEDTAHENANTFWVEYCHMVGRGITKDNWRVTEMRHLEELCLSAFLKCVR